MPIPIGPKFDGSGAPGVLQPATTLSPDDRAVRDMFAAHAMAAIYPRMYESDTEEFIAQSAYVMADAMMAERARRQEGR